MYFLIDKLNLLMRFIVIGAFFLLVVTAFLTLVHKWLKKSGYIRLLYVFMILSAAGAVFIFLMGILYVCMPFNMPLNSWTFHISGWKAASGGADGPFILAAAGIWLAGIFWVSCKNREENNALSCLCQLNRPVVDEQIQNRYYGVSIKTGVKNIPLLFGNAAVEVPFLKGVRHAEVVLPEKELSPQEQILVFAHELTHHRHHDLFFRYFLKIIFIIYWFLPLGSLWMEMFVELQETLCDIDVCRIYGNNFTAKAYYTTILSISSRKWNQPEKLANWQISSLSEHVNQLERRIGNMIGFRNGTRRRGIETAIMAAGSILLIGGVLAGMYWPDILVKRDKITEEIEICTETSETLMDEIITDVNVIIRKSDMMDTQENLQWNRLTSYSLKPGWQISSEVFQGSEGENLVVMIVASHPGYEVRLMKRTETVFCSKMDETVSLNLRMENEDYRLYICNTTGIELTLELYCTR